MGRNAMDWNVKCQAIVNVMVPFVATFAMLVCQSVAHCQSSISANPQAVAGGSAFGLGLPTHVQPVLSQPNAGQDVTNLRSSGMATTNDASPVPVPTVHTPVASRPANAFSATGRHDAVITHGASVVHADVNRAGPSTTVAGDSSDVVFQERLVQGAARFPSTSSGAAQGSLAGGPVVPVSGALPVSDQDPASTAISVPPASMAAPPLAGSSALPAGDALSALPAAGDIAASDAASSNTASLPSPLPASAGMSVPDTLLALPDNPDPALPTTSPAGELPANLPTAALPAINAMNPGSQAAAPSNSAASEVALPASNVPASNVPAAMAGAPAEPASTPGFNTLPRSVNLPANPNLPATPAPSLAAQSLAAQPADAMNSGLSSSGMSNAPAASAWKTLDRTTLPASSGYPSTGYPAMAGNTNTTTAAPAPVAPVPAAPAPVAAASLPRLPGTYTDEQVLAMLATMGISKTDPRLAQPGFLDDVYRAFYQQYLLPNGLVAPASPSGALATGQPASAASGSEMALSVPRTNAPQPWPDSAERSRLAETPGTAVNQTLGGPATRWSPVNQPDRSVMPTSHTADANRMLNGDRAGTDRAGADLVSSTGGQPDRRMRSRASEENFDDLEGSDVFNVSKTNGSTGAATGSEQPGASENNPFVSLLLLISIAGNFFLFIGLRRVWYRHRDLIASTRLVSSE
ncbi:hypothetical protein SV7mr_45240 [Stieleria bergensis]|uniref:Uncharacterized protein n=1 Tax=Stieleria bergensis TaxID=2528025 RepID=A0A517T0V9_9BACT|nr:hypothetical protein SV7mr_45240 [Planctomycetes bacterium SV_7m_r]